MFKITEDCLENKPMPDYFSSEAKKGTVDFDELIKKFEAEPQYIFRMRDQDLEVLYIGYSDDCNRPSGFDPLDMYGCLLYTSDAADEEDSVDLGGRRIIKKKKK